MAESLEQDTSNHQALATVSSAPQVSDHDSKQQLISSNNKPSETGRPAQELLSPREEVLSNSADSPGSAPVVGAQDVSAALLSTDTDAKQAPPTRTDGTRTTSDDGHTGDSSNNFVHPFAHSDDPLLRQLPRDLVPFVKTPDETNDELERVANPENGPCHCCCVALCCLCCCYSLCRTRVVRQGQVMLTQKFGVPQIYGSGLHTILSPFNTILGVRNVTEPIISNGPVHMISVEVGQLGYGVDMKTGRPVLLTRGKHFIRNETFVWKNFITLNQPKTQLDNMEIIRVETGSVGYCFRQGKLVILHPGLHTIVPPDRFGGMMTTQMTILDLDHAVHETSDYVPLAIKAAVFYRIADPYKALVRIQNVEQQIKETSIATLAGIIRSSSLSDVASRSRPFYHKKRVNVAAEQKDDMNDNDEESALLAQSANNNNNNNYNKNDMVGEPEFAQSQPFFQHVHDEFITNLHDHVLDEWGVEIQNIRIESLKINDATLQSDISKQAIDVSKQHNQYIMLQKRQEIVTVEAQTRATQIEIDTQAEVNRKIQQAKADADSVVIRAKAEKEATELRGHGDAEYARLIQSTQLGGEIARMKIQAEALQGLKQVAYVPHLNPLMTQGKEGLFKLQGGFDALPKMQ